MQQTEPLLTKEEREILLLTAVHPNLKHLGLQEIGERYEALD